MPWPKGKKFSDEHRKKMSAKHKLLGTKPPSPKGKKQTEEHRLNRRLSQLGERGSNWKGGLPICPDCGKKLGSYKSKRCSICAFKGERSFFWKGGITEKDKVIRASFQYRLWRRSVFERDNYTCIWCRQKGGKLNVDHIKPWALYPELRFAIDNGRTLCADCHRKTDTFGWKTMWNNKKYGKSR